MKNNTIKKHRHRYVICPNNHKNCHYWPMYDSKNKWGCECGKTRSVRSPK